MLKSLISRNLITQAFRENLIGADELIRVINKAQAELSHVQRSVCMLVP